MGDGFYVHECVFLNITKDLYLAVVMRVIDHKQVHRVICRDEEKSCQPCCVEDPACAQGNKPKLK